MRRTVKNIDTAMMIAPKRLNSAPRSGKSARTPDAPITGIIAVRTSEPHAAHPTPKSPTPIPAPLVAALLPARASDRDRSKYTMSDICTPNKRAMSTVPSAERKVKFVVIDPRSEKRNMILSPQNTFVFPNTLVMNARLGSHIVSANAVKAVAMVMAIYAGLRKICAMVRNM